MTAVTWGLGVAAGVALGAYLTAVGGTGAPGPEVLDASELVVLPAVSGGAVFAVVLVFSVVRALVLGSANAPHDDDHDGENH